MTGNDKPDGYGRSAGCGFKVNRPETFVGILLGPREKSWSAIGGNEAPNRRMAGGGGFAAQSVHIVIGELGGGRVLNSGCEKQEIAVVRDALVVSIDRLQSVTHDVSAGLNGLISEIRDRNIEVNRAEDFAVDQLIVIDSERGAAGGR